jgi:predicted outer membrane repeat protein
LVRCTFTSNAAEDQGGALYFGAGSTGLLKDCSFDGNVSATKNDIARDTDSNVTFACADGLVGPSVRMNGTEITKLPALTCSTPKYSCDGLTGICKQDQSGVFPSKQACSAGCTATPTPAPCQVPRNCGQYNNSVVCGHTFTGCEFVCGKGSDPANVGCCHANIRTDDTCNSCVDFECKPPPPLPPPVTTKYFCVTTPNYHCIESSSGTFPSATDCEKGCQQPPPPLTPAPPTPPPTPAPPAPPPTKCAGPSEVCGSKPCCKGYRCDPTTSGLPVCK